MISCDAVRDVMDEYLAGVLDPERRRTIGDHLAGCDVCRTDFETAALIGARAAALPRTVEPPRDLWRGIAPRLSRRRGRIQLPVWAAAAAALLLMTATAVATILLVRPGTNAGGFAGTEARYARAAIEVSDLYLRSRDSLGQETRAVLERNLAVIERALGEAREALAADPANRTLEALVVAAYKRKIAFLERAAAFDQES